MNKSTEIQYQDIRSNIKDADILLYKGTGLFSYLIKKITRSEYSHAGLAVRWNDRLMVMEAVGRGVIVTPLSTNVRKYHGDVEWFQCKEKISDEKRLLIIQFAQKELGKKYSILGVLWIAYHILLKKPFTESESDITSKRLFCSLYVASSYNQASLNLDLARGKPDYLTTPDDIRLSPLLEIGGILKNNKNI
ncbi:MAG: YiiX/YebB-like N1pC/P60 family cysteine hydrolase [Saprospiraceae bacterium]